MTGQDPRVQNRQIDHIIWDGADLSWAYLSKMDLTELTLWYAKMHNTDFSDSYLSGRDIAALELSNQEILDAIEDSLRAQGEGQTVIEPRMHLVPEAGRDGHFNVLRGYPPRPLEVPSQKSVAPQVCALVGIACYERALSG